MKNSKNLEIILPSIIVKWETLSTAQKQEILGIIEDITCVSPSIKNLKPQAFSCLQMKPK
ncbi:hypothetical protein B11Cv2_001040 [Bartonella sp. 1-1C]|nr:hypothetical protein [Bartonella sp. 1-1C]ATO56891.1 hypothetical protein B11Cv2_001040 [Bartonella sp. 1-1C]CBI80316.1 hypothetical protein B11C_40006 [Bartonella sp. 1-1C]